MGQRAMRMGQRAKRLEHGAEDIMWRIERESREAGKLRGRKKKMASKPTSSQAL